MKKRGFTLIELSIGMVLLMIILNSAFLLLGSALKWNQQLIVEKEIVEIGESLSSVIRTEFSRSQGVIAVLDTHDQILLDVGKEPVDVKALHLKKAVKSAYQSSYLEELIYLKEQSDRRSVWIYKNAKESVQLNVKYYNFYGGYEIGTQLENFTISKVRQGVYQVNLRLGFSELGIQHEKSFLVKLQD